MEQGREQRLYKDAVVSDLLDDLSDAVARTCELARNFVAQAEGFEDQQVSERLQQAAMRLREAMLELERPL